MVAHGDGAAQVAVQGVAYCPQSCTLASVGQGVGGVRLWRVAENGMLGSYSSH